MGEADINGIQLSVANFAPTITTQPASQTVVAGGMVNLNVTPTGTALFYYQWFKNGGMVLGATNSALTFSSAGVTNSGVYYVVVTNAYGLNISQPVTVTVGDPQLLAWGDNTSGQLGDGTTNDAYFPESVASNVVVMAAGGSHSLFVKADGTLWTMGNNSAGQLGDGTTTQQNSPVSVASNVVAVAGGDWHSLYVKSNGTLWAMGYNYFGELGDGTTTQQNSPVSVASNVVAVVAGCDHSLYLKSDGTLWAMGFNSYGQLGDGTTTSPTFPVSVASNVVAVAAGYYHSLYLKIDGTLWAMGDNTFGQLGDGTTTQQNSPVSVASNVVAVAAGAFHSLYLKSDDSLWTVGYNISGELGDGTTINRSNAVSVASNVVVTAGGCDYSLYLKGDGTLWAMGYNDDGELGDGTTTQQTSPVAVPGMSLATVVSGSSAYHTLAVGTLLPPVITSQPSNQSVVVGGNVTFTVTADGFRPLSYQWQFNGTNLPSATNASFEIASAALSDTGDYAVIVTNNYGSTVSFTATLTVTNQPPPTATVTVAAAPTNAGSVSGGGVYIVGSNAVLTATASNNWQFINWNDGTTNNPYVITVPATNITYTAQFEATATIMVSANPNNGGSVIGGGTFLIGSTNLISAVASNGWIFTGWSDTTSNNPYSITVTSNLTLTANFEPAVSVTTVALPPEGGLTTGDGTYAIGGSATVTATATNGWLFLNWNGAVTNNPWTFLVSSNATVCTANFAQTSTVTGLANPTNAGSVAGGGVYIVGSNAVLTATSSNAWQFINWNDGTTNNPYVITVPDTNITYTANFAATAIITVSANPNSGGSVTGGGTFLVGSTNLISAVASNNWVFAGWSDGTINNSYSITVTSNLTLTANFVPATTVTTVALPPEGGLTAGDGTYAIGNDATVTATASNGWLFLNWNGAVTNNPWTFLVSSNATVCTANFAQTSTVTGLANPTNAGSVAGGGEYIVGSNAVLTATASNTWQFIYWNDGTTNNPYVITVPDTNITYTAQFAATATITVEVSPSPNNGGYVTGGGTFLVGSTNLISAVASNNWVFARWNDDTTNNSYAIVVATNRTYTADFVHAATVTTEALPPDGGSTTGDGAYAIGSSATVTATPGDHWLFLNWNGTITNYTTTGNQHNPLNFTVTTNITQTANFGQVTNGFVYLVLNNYTPPQVEIIGYVGPTNIQVVIPKTIDGFKVTIIGPGAFWNNGVTNLVITGNITNISSGSIAVAVIEFVGVAAGIFIAADAFEDVVEADLIDMGADAAADLLEDLGEVLSDLATVTLSADPENGGHCDFTGLYAKEVEVRIKAVPSDGWKFKHWKDSEGLIVSSDEAYYFIPTDDATYTAEFAQITVTVTGEASPIDGGTVIGGGTFHDGDSVTLTATTNIGWRFDHWDDSSTENPRTFDAPDVDTTYTATFVQQVKVTAEANDEEGGTVTGGGTYDAGDPVTLTATTNSGWRFNNWTDEEGVVLSLENSYEFAAPDEDTTYTANFVEQVEVEAEAEPEYGGTVTGGGTYDAGSPVTLIATAYSGWRFNGWFLDSFLTNAPVFVTVASSLQEGLTYKAKFVQTTTVTGLANPTNAGSVTGGGVYDVGDTNVILTATASNNWQFVSWNDGTTANPYTNTAPATNITYTANFATVTSVAVSSSINPCGYRDGVTFTASVTPTNATGTVQFLTNGVAFDLETLTNGAATSFTPTSLPRGTNLITVEYSGDSLDLPGTNTLEQVVTNHPPQAAPATYTLTAVPGYKILITDLATNWSDADGDLITLASVNASTNGGAVSIGGKYIYYTDTNLVTDQFTYLISDGQGGTGIGTVNLLSSNGTVNTNRTLNITGLTPNGDGSVTINFAGIPGYTYWVQAATNVAQPQWETISTNVAGTNGLWNYTDTNAAHYSLRFYRTCKP